MRAKSRARRQLTLLEKQAIRDEFAKSNELQIEFDNDVNKYLAFKRHEFIDQQRFEASAFSPGPNEQNKQQTKSSVPQSSTSSSRPGRSSVEISEHEQYARGVPVKNVL